MAFHVLNSISVSRTFFARTRAQRTLKRKWGVFEQAIKYKTKWEKTLDFLKKQANALNRDINYEFPFPPCYKENFSFT